LAILRREPADRLPATLDGGAHRGLCPALVALLKEKTGSDDEAGLFDFDIRIVEGRMTSNGIDPRQYYSDLPPEATLGDWGTASISWPEHHFKKNIGPFEEISSPREVEAYPIPGYDAFPAKGQIQILKSAGYMVSIYSGSLFEWSYWLRGHENFLVDCLTDVPLAEAILDKVYSFTLKMASENVLAGADIICFFDDTGFQDRLQIPPATWRSLVKPRWRRIFEAVKRLNPDCHIFIHTCGNVEAIIPDLIEIGLDILNPLQPEAMNLDAVVRNYGRDLCFWGSLSNQRTFPFGTPDQVREEVRHRKALFGPFWNCILSPSNILTPEVPWENIVAFLDETGLWSQP